MEIDTADFLETWRARQSGLPWRAIARNAGVSPTTVDKVRRGEDVRGEKVAAVEKAMRMPVGSIQRYKETGEWPEIPSAPQETQIEIPELGRGERLYEKQIDHGYRYRLETADGYGVSYTWPSPQPAHEILPHLRSLATIVATAGGLMDS